MYFLVGTHLLNPAKHCATGGSGLSYSSYNFYCLISGSLQEAAGSLLVSYIPVKVANLYQLDFVCSQVYDFQGAISVTHAIMYCIYFIIMR